jgi:hypothetical protein
MAISDELRRTVVVDIITTARILVRVARDGQIGIAFIVQQGREFLPNLEAATPPKPSFKQQGSDSFWCEQVARELGGPRYYEVAWSFVDDRGQLLRKLEPIPVRLSASGSAIGK